MSLVSYLGTLQLPEQRMSLGAIQEPLFALYSKHVKLGQLSRLQVHFIYKYILIYNFSEINV